MSTFIRSTIAALTLIGAVAATAVAQDYTPYEEEQGMLHYDPEQIWETIQERGQ